MSNNVLQATGENILEGNGKISKEQAAEKAEIEYKKYSQKTLSQVEKDYLSQIQQLESLVKQQK